MSFACPWRWCRTCWKRSNAVACCAHTDDEPPAYLPGRPLETTPVIEALDAVRTSGERNRLALDHLPHHAAVSDLARQIDEAVAGVLRGRTLKDLALMENDTVTRLPEQRRDA